MSPQNNFSVVCGVPPNTTSEMSILQTDSAGLGVCSLSLVISKSTQLAKEQLLPSPTAKTHGEVATNLPAASVCCSSDFKLFPSVLGVSPGGSGRGREKGQGQRSGPSDSRLEALLSHADSTITPAQGTGSQPRTQFTAVVSPAGDNFAVFGDVVTTRGLQVVFRGQKPGMLVNSLQYTGQPPHQSIIQPKISAGPQSANLLERHRPYQSVQALPRSLGVCHMGDQRCHSKEPSSPKCPQGSD